MSDPRLKPLERGVIGELFWNIAEAVVIYDGKRVLQWSPSAERIFGIGADEATADGFDLRTLFGTSRVEFDRMLVEGGDVELDCKEGCDLIFEAHSWRLGGDPSAPHVVVLRDVTRERHQVAGLKLLNEMVRELVRTSDSEPALQRVVDDAKRLTGARFSALVVLREGTEDEIQHFVYNAPRELFPSRLPRVVGLLAVPISTRSAARLDDIRGHPAGIGIPVEHPPIKALIAVPLIAGDRVLGELAVANGPDDRVFDETDEALLTELGAHASMALTVAAARQAQDQAEEEHRALVTLALHNIRTPLTVAKGFVATLRQHYDTLTPALREDSFDAIMRALDRIHGLSEGALLRNWEEEERREPNVEIDPSDLVERLLDDLRPVAGSVVLEFSSESGAPARYVGDAQLTREVLQNLLSNAIRFSPPNESVVVTCRSEGRSIRFDVTDRGPGITPEQQPRLFEPPRPGASQRTGRGLWTVRRLVERMGGTVGVTSRKGEGSTFWITLPVEPAA